MILLLYLPFGFCILIHCYLFFMCLVRCPWVLWKVPINNALLLLTGHSYDMVAISYNRWLKRIFRASIVVLPEVVLVNLSRIWRGIVAVDRKQQASAHPSKPTWLFTAQTSWLRFGTLPRRREHIYPESSGFLFVPFLLSVRFNTIELRIFYGKPCTSWVVVGQQSKNRISLLETRPPEIQISHNLVETAVYLPSSILDVSVSVNKWTHGITYHWIT